jgi:glutamate N-acetyltransferase/amino-acid N-acetyltransferase
MAKDAKISPFAPATMPSVPVIEGARFASAEAGIRYKGRKDLTIVVLDAGTTVAGVLTKSKTCSAAVSWCKANLAGGRARALVVNSGNANAFTGKKGRESVEATAGFAAAAVGCRGSEVFISSTGVIGEPLDASKFGHLLAGLAQSAKADAIADAARAIMTTDTFPKLATRTVSLGGVDVHLNGIAKGAGMIAPDMATMLVYMFTDAPIAAPVLQSLVSRHVETTFNSITIDSDTSTSDTCLLFATGAAAKRGAPHVADAFDPRLAAFDAALHSLMLELAHLVTKDGEGLTKFVEIAVHGAESDQAAKRIGMAIANSPLVKTAFAGEDPNWGRIVMAVGKSGELADRDRLSIAFGDIVVARHGERAPSYDEATVAKYMKNNELVVRVDLGIGPGRATVWTCDLTHDYISINADYRS